MARRGRAIPQKTLSPDDRAVFEQMIERIKPLVGVHLDKQPYPFIIDTRIFPDLLRYPVSLPHRTVATWGGYYGYGASPTYANLLPEQRWGYVAWLAGDESLGVQLFRLMRIYALCAELEGPRRNEALAALYELHAHPATDIVTQNTSGNVLTLAYAALQPHRLADLLATYQPVGLSTDVVLRCVDRAGLEAPGSLLLDVAIRCNFRLGRGMTNRRQAVETAMYDIATRWGAREGITVAHRLLEHTPTIPTIATSGHNLLHYMAHKLGLSLATLVFERSEVDTFMRGLAAAAQEQVRLQRRNEPAVDGLALLDGILHGDNGSSIQLDLSGAADYTMTAAEQQALDAKIRIVRDVVGVKVVEREWDVYTGWNREGQWLPESVLVSSLPIKTPGSTQPWNAPTPPTFSTAAYRTLTPEQRWWYLDWLAHEPVQPLDLFLVVRYKGVESAYSSASIVQQRKQIERWINGERDATTGLQTDNLFGLLERLFERSSDEYLRRSAIDHVMPVYAEYGDSQRATMAFNTTAFATDQGPRLLAYLWEAGGTLQGIGLLNVARSGGFNHTPLTRECFDQIAHRSIELLAEWEMTHGPLAALPTASYRVGRGRKGALSGVQVTAQIARQAQEDIKAMRRSAPRTARMSAAEIAAERAELADLPTNAGDDQSASIYDHLSADPQLASLYVAQGVQALERNQAPIAVAFLRRACDLQPDGAARQLLPLARLRLREWQQQQTSPTETR